jgi:O-antigen ligase
MDSPFILGATLGLLPAILLLYLLFFEVETFFYLMAFFIPLSVKADFPGGFTVSAPGEVMAVLLLFRMLTDPDVIRAPDRRIFSHPLFIVLMVYSVWLVVTALLGEVPLVSLKRVFIVILYISVFFYFGATRFTDPEKVMRFFLLYAAGMVIPVINGAVWHAQYDFSPKASYYMPQPFFIEHTLYGAVLAFLIPAVGYLAFTHFSTKAPLWQRVALVLLFVLLVAAEFLSFSRAAWLSLAVVPVFVMLTRAGVRLKYMVAVLAIVASGVLLNLDPILRMISRNESRSNRGSIREQVQSVSNIQTDISNLERINRWKCALRMFDDRPVTGFGPGSYQFVYYRYQFRKDMTRISTVHGEKGNAHSEYLGHMAEAGLPGLILFLATLLIAVQSALRVLYRSVYRQWRATALVVVLCLLTFYVHAIFNAFLETDEIGALYYAGLAAIMALDLSSNRAEAAETT